MERKIGEIFEYNGEWYQCVKQNGCCNCAFYNTSCHLVDELSCDSLNKKRKEKYIFKKLEKVGKPFPCRNMSSGRYGIMVQWYKVFVEPILTDDSTLSWYNSINETILIALNNKEDMEEDNNTKHSNSENIGKNLKPFDLQAAKSGKPVCTRDGRKARIICFDSKNDPQRPIIALVENNSNELLYEYTIKGKDRFSHISTTGTSDLMMLPEKKEGWVNVYKETSGEYYMDKIIHKTEKFAFDVACPNDYIGTVKIEWYE